MRLRSPSAVRIASLNAYDRWQSANQNYERLLKLFSDEERVCEAISRGRHLTLCCEIATSSGQVEAARRSLVTLLDRQERAETSRRCKAN